MYFLEYYYEKVIKYDLINKFNYKTINKLPILEKITLNFKCKNASVQRIAKTLLAMGFITNKKSSVTLVKNPDILFKVYKGAPSGCSVILTKNYMYKFLAKLLNEILPKIKDFSNIKTSKRKNTFFVKLSNNNLILKELEDQYPLFYNLTNLNISIKTNVQTKNELQFILKSFKLYILDKWSSG